MRALTKDELMLVWGDGGGPNNTVSTVTVHAPPPPPSFIPSSPPTPPSIGGGGVPTPPITTPQTLAQQIASHVHNNVNSNHTALGAQAQANVTAALQRIDAALHNMSPTATIPIGTQSGTQTVTVAQLENIVENDTFNIVEPGTFVSNGGVGAANYNTGTDSLAYTSFDNVGNTWATLYGNDSMNFIMLHEAAHLTDYGYSQTQLNAQDFAQDPRLQGTSYVNSTYWSNNEALANSFAETALGVLGLGGQEVGNYIGNLDNNNQSNSLIYGGMIYSSPGAILANDIAIYNAGPGPHSGGGGGNK